MSILKSCACAAIVLAALALPRPAAPDTPDPADSFLFSVYDPDDDGIAGPHSGTAELETGRAYTVVVTGTFSFWSDATWQETGRVCPAGALAAEPRDGVDAEYVFARPLGPDDLCDEDQFPLHIGALEFSTDDGATWGHVEPVVRGYSDDGTYAYRVAGQGFPLQVRLRDAVGSDNQGSLLVVVDLAAGGALDAGPWLLVGGNLILLSVAGLFLYGLIGGPRRSRSVTLPDETRLHPDVAANDRERPGAEAGSLAPPMSATPNAARLSRDRAEPAGHPSGGSVSLGLGLLAAAFGLVALVRALSSAFGRRAGRAH